MLTDDQVNELERLIVFSTMDNLPLVLSRAIPLLFSELRLVRATLDSKVGDFLGGITHADNQRGEVAEFAGSEGLRERHEPLANRKEVQGGGHSPTDTGVAGGFDPANGHPEGGKRRRGRPKKERGPIELDTGADQQAVGGAIAPETRDAGILGIEASSKLKGSY